MGWDTLASISVALTVRCHLVIAVVVVVVVVIVRFGCRGHDFVVTVFKQLNGTTEGLPEHCRGLQ